MLSLLEQCCGASKAKNSFEQARIACTYPDWRTPDVSYLAIIFQTLEGGNPEVTAEQGMKSLLNSISQEQHCKSAPFLLKNLLILDYAVREHLFLNKIATYEITPIVYLDASISSEIPHLRDLITNYYSYIREKAKSYSSLSPQLRDRSKRVNYLKKCTPVELLAEVNMCFRVQNLILDVTQKYRDGSKASPLIQIVFTSLLKTYLFFYSIVSIALKEYSNLNTYDLEYLYRLVKYLNKQYTRNFFLFIEKNKCIDCFSKIKYNEFIMVDDRLLHIIEAQIHLLKQQAQEVSYPKQVEPIKIDSIKEEGVYVSPFFIQALTDTQGEDQDYNPNRRIKIQIDLTKSMRDARDFENYENFYSEQFVTDDDGTERNPEEKIKRMFKVKNKVSLYEMSPKSDDRGFSMLGESRYSADIWSQWDNIYSETTKSIDASSS